MVIKASLYSFTNSRRGKMCWCEQEINKEVAADRLGEICESYVLLKLSSTSTPCSVLVTFPSIPYWNPSKQLQLEKEAQECNQNNELVNGLTAIWHCLVDTSVLWDLFVCLFNRLDWGRFTKYHGPPGRAWKYFVKQNPKLKWYLLKWDYT